MASVTRICRKCGAKIFSDAPEGLCTGLRPAKQRSGCFPDAVAGVDDPGASDKLARNDVAPRLPTKSLREPQRCWES